MCLRHSTGPCGQSSVGKGRMAEEVPGGSGARLMIGLEGM